MPILGAIIPQIPIFNHKSIELCFGISGFIITLINIFLDPNHYKKSYAILLIGLWISILLTILITLWLPIHWLTTTLFLVLAMLQLLHYFFHHTHK